MLAFCNRTKYAASLFAMPDKDGRDVVVVVTKGTFVEHRDRLFLAEEQVPLVHADEYLGAPESTSMKAASDMVLFKPATDVVVIGSAYAPGGNPVDQLDVELAVGAVNKRVRVFGDRAWKKSLVMSTHSAPQPFTVMPLVYEHAFGGVYRQPGERETFIADQRNPIGRGFWGDSHQAVGQPLPNIEDPAQLVRSWNDRPAPQGFGWISPHWEPRRQLAGTYDESWQQKRMPLLPADFQEAFFNAAPADQQIAPYCTGGERVTLDGFRADGAWRFTLPRDVVSVRMLYPRQVRGQELAVLDTVIIEPDWRRCQIVWRVKIIAPDPITHLLYVELNSQLNALIDAKQVVTEEVLSS